MEKTSRIKKFIHTLLNRKYIFEGKSIHQGDIINLERCLDISLIDVLNNTYGFKLNRVNGWKVFLMALQIFFIFAFIGIPSLLKMKWESKKYMVAFALFQWYAIMWFRYLKYERSEKHLLQNKNGVKIVSQWDRITR